MEDEFFFHHYLPPSHSLSSISLTLSLPLLSCELLSRSRGPVCVAVWPQVHQKRKSLAWGQKRPVLPPEGMTIVRITWMSVQHAQGITRKMFSSHSQMLSHDSLCPSFYTYVPVSIFTVREQDSRARNLYVGERLSNDVCSPPHAQWATHRETRQTRTTEVDWKHDSVRGMRRASLPAAGLVGIGSTENAPPPLPPTTKENGKRHTGRANRCGPLQNSLLGALFWSFLRISLTFNHDIN